MHKVGTTSPHDPVSVNTVEDPYNFLSGDIWGFDISIDILKELLY